MAGSEIGNAEIYSPLFRESAIEILHELLKRGVLIDTELFPILFPVSGRVSSPFIRWGGLAVLLPHFVEQAVK